MKSYRAEIDGLRAYAVILATGFQFFRESFPNGYLGVDMFAVISGYVITSSLTSRKEQNFSNFAISFYKRRIKRLLPALLIFVLIASFLTVLIIPNPVRELNTAMYSLTGMSNIYLMNISSDYFSTDAELNPFTQTWSLGVEEQFYFLFPFLIWFSGYAQPKKTSSKNFSNILSFVFLISLLGFICLHFFNPTYAYFFTPTRLWQMCLGSLTFLEWDRRDKLYATFQRIPALCPTLIILLITTINSNNALLSTLSITFLTSVLLLSLKENTFSFYLFTNRFSKYIAKISYSIYLWRWAISSFLLWTIGLTVFTKIFGLIVLLIIADFSYRFFEDPKRFLPDLIQKIGIIFSLLLLEVPGMIAIKALEKNSKNLNPYKYEYLISWGRDFLPTKEDNLNNKFYKEFNKRNCLLKNDFDLDLENVEKKCTLLSKNNNANTIFLVGSSHAAHFLESQYLLFKNNPINISSLTVFGCSFFERNNFFKKSKRVYCGGDSTIQERIYKQFSSKAKKGDIFIISSKYFKKDFTNLSWIEEPQQLDLLLSFNNDMKKKGVYIVLIKPSPYFKNSPYWCSRIKYFSKKRYYENCFINYSKTYKENENINKIISQLPPNIFVFDPIKAVCNNLECSMFDESNKTLFADDDHFSDYANKEYIYPKLSKFLKENKLL